MEGDTEHRQKVGWVGPRGVGAIGREEFTEVWPHISSL